MRAGGLEEQKGVRGECRERERYGARGEAVGIEKGNGEGEVWGRERGGVTAFNPNGGQRSISTDSLIPSTGTINVFRLLRFFQSRKANG